MLFSTAASFAAFGQSFGPSDVISWNGASFARVLAAAADLGVPPGVNLDALALLPDGSLLASFDVTVRVGGPGGIVLADEDVGLRDPFTGAWSPFFDGSQARVPERLDLVGLHPLGTSGVLLIALDGAGKIDGIRFGDTDVLQYDAGADTWELSSVGADGAPNAAVDGFHAAAGPRVGVPPDIILACGDDPNDLALTGVAQAFADCGGGPPIPVDLPPTDTILPGTCPDVLVIERTWTATDADGLTGSAVQRIRVVDDTPPVLLLPPDVTVGCDDDTSPATTGVARAGDACGPSGIGFADAVTGTGCPRTILRVWAARDACGNETRGTQTIQVGGGSDVFFATGPVGPDGGAVVSPGTGAGIDVPPGSLFVPVVISVSEAGGDGGMPADLVALGPPIEIGPSGTVFNPPATVTVPVNLFRLPPGRTKDDVRISRIEPDGTRTLLPVVSFGESFGRPTVSALTDGLSIFQAVVPAAAPARRSSSGGGCALASGDDRDGDAFGGRDPSLAILLGVALAVLALRRRRLHGSSS